MRELIIASAAIAAMYLGFMAVCFSAESVRRRRAQRGRGGIETGAFTDVRDGAEYKTAEIGGVTWLAENLRYDADGSWLYGGGGGKYGRLYTWEAAVEACPEGWRLPSVREWAELLEAFGGAELSGRNLKSLSGWGLFGNGYDMCGCSFPPGGCRLAGGEFAYAGRNGLWWLSEPAGSDGAFCAEFSYRSNGALVSARDMRSGLSVRCVRDDRSMPPSVFFPWGQPDYDK
ncbi:hypothetical protein R80B4_01918 [Fibrobacteres bacterium R8-0-B4]